jgi:phage RecT family recombinase
MPRPPSGPPPVNRSLVAPTAKRKDLENYVQIAAMFDREDRRADLIAMLGSVEAAERFLAVTLNAIATDSDLLLNATPASIIQAVKDSATLGLEPTGLTGEATILVYKGIATLQVMWRGYLRRIRNSRKVDDIDVQLVYANDEWDYGWSQDGGWFKHHPARVQDDRGDYAGAYAYARMPSGFVELEWMSASEINYVKNTFSPSVKAGKASPWDTSWGEMARKTVLRRLAKRLPQEAVALLLEIDERADAAEAAAEAPTPLVSRARQVALAATVGRRAARPAALPASTATTDTGQDAGEPAAQAAEPETAEVRTEDIVEGPGEPSDGETIPFDMGESG